MLKATLREYLGTTERAKQVIRLDRAQGDITLGRAESCTYQIGKSLGQFGEGISRIQATIEFKPDRIVLVDGSRKEQSTNRVWVHGAPIDGEIDLYPGLELTLFRAGGKISLVINDPDTAGDGSSDTYTGQELLGLLQEQTEGMSKSIVALQKQVVALGEQLAHREKLDAQREELDAQRADLDAQQSQQLNDLQRRVRHIVSGVLVFAAVIVLGSGLLKDLGADERKEWRSLLSSVIKELLLAGALGGGALLVQKSKENNGAIVNGAIAPKKDPPTT